MTVASYVQLATDFVGAGFAGVGTIIEGIWSAGPIGQISLLGTGIGVVMMAYRLIKR